MAFKQVRKITRYGKSSQGIVLPKEWLDYYGLGPGDEIVILANDALVIVPKHLEQEARLLLERKVAKE